MGDWMISKKRYWGLALPIWRLRARLRLVRRHRQPRGAAASGPSPAGRRSRATPRTGPGSTRSRSRCAACGGTASRIPDVGNPWLDAGIVPYSTLGYRRATATTGSSGSRPTWSSSASRASSATGSTPAGHEHDAWTGRARPFKTLLGYARCSTRTAARCTRAGATPSSSTTPPSTMGADVMRWMFLAHKPESNLNFGYGPGGEVRRRFLIPLWNVYAFFVQYANGSDGWTAPASAAGTTRRPALDRDRRRSAGPSSTAGSCCACTRTVREVTERMADYDGRAGHRGHRGLRRGALQLVRPAHPAALLGGRPGRAGHALRGAGDPVAPAGAHACPSRPRTLYQNLVRGRGRRRRPRASTTTAWPTAPEADADGRPRLLADMALVLRLAALGRSARSGGRREAAPAAGDGHAGPARRRTRRRRSSAWASTCARS